MPLSARPHEPRLLAFAGERWQHLWDLLRARGCAIARATRAIPRASWFLVVLALLLLAFVLALLGEPTVGRGGR
jgi:hypothetical protein